MSAMKPPPQWRWLAGPDGEAHAFPLHGRGRALCGAAHFEERFAHPATSRHPACLAEADRLTQAALGVAPTPAVARTSIPAGGGWREDSPTYRNNMREAGRGELLR